MIGRYRRSFQDVGLKRDQVVVGQVGDVRLCVLVAHVRLHEEKVTSVLVPETQESVSKKEELTRLGL